MRAVDGVSFTLREGETLGLVGESGCGKSTLCRAILQLTTPTSGSVRFAGQELVGRSRRELRADAPPDADDLPGPVRLAQSAQAGGPDHRRAARAARLARGAELKRRVQELLRPRRPAGRALQPVPARVLRRPAPADRHRPRTCVAAQADRRRRAGLRPRRLRPGADHQPARGRAGASSASPISSSPTTSASSVTSPTGSR